MALNHGLEHRAEKFALTDEVSQLNSLVSHSTLVWEDARPDGNSPRPWWLVRATDVAAARDFFIVEDDVSGYLVGVVRPRPGKKFEMIAAAFLGSAEQVSGSRADGIAMLKGLVADWQTAPHNAALGQGVRRWRRRRSWIIARANFPLATGAFVIGGLLGFAIGMFAVSSGAVGVPFVSVALLIGAVAGTLLKLIADRKPSPVAAGALAGSWERFMVVSFAALIGAAMGSGVVLALFWY